MSVNEECLGFGVLVGVRVPNTNYHDIVFEWEASEGSLRGSEINWKLSRIFWSHARFAAFLCNV